MESKRLKVISAVIVWMCAAIVLGGQSGLIEKGGEWMSRKTVPDRVAEYGPAARGRLLPRFERIGVSYPPARVTFIGLKTERVLEVWVAGDSSSAFRLLTRYPILGASGKIGPKLREGDRQVPEGFYSIESLNPNSAYHLSLRVGYPNAEDREQAAAEGRENPGGDIMIHGGDLSIGCLAVGDEAAEDLFVLAAETGIENLDVILSPVDFRLRPDFAGAADAPDWLASRYAAIRAALTRYDAAD